MSSYRLQVRNETGVVKEGTGWFLEPGLVVTAFHVVGSEVGKGWLHQGDETIHYSLRLAEDAEVSLTPALFDEEADIAFLVADNRASLENLLVIQETPAKAGQTWRTDGFPKFHGGKPFTLDGAVTAVREGRLSDALQLTVNQHTDVPWDGVSGAPLIIAGKVAGVITQVTNRTATGWAASGTAVLKLLQHYKAEKLRETPYDLFISHNAHDVEWVETLARNLVAHGYRVFFDRWVETAGLNPIELSERVLASCRKSILIITPEALDSGWAKHAYQKLLSKKDKEPDFKIVLAIPFGQVGTPILDDVIQVDFREPDAYLEAFGRLVLALGFGEPVAATSADIEIPGRRFCLRSTEAGIHTFVDTLMGELKIDRSPPVAILSQAGRHHEFVAQAILEKSAAVWGQDRVRHISLPYSPDAKNKVLFRFLADQCGLTDGKVNTSLEFQKALKKLMIGKPLFLMVTGIENTAESGQQAVAGVLRNLWEKHNDTFKLVIMGGKGLAELKYAGGKVSLLNIAEEKRCPELSVADIMRVAEDLSLIPRFGEETADRLLTLTGGHPCLVLEGMRQLKRKPETDLTALKEELAQSGTLWQLFTGYLKDPVMKREVKACLKRYSVGTYQPYLHNPVLSDLYWKNLLTVCEDADERKKLLVWRSQMIMETGREILDGKE